MTYSEAQNRATQKYKKTKCHRVPLDLRNEDYDRIKSAADAAGESVSGYIKEAVKRRIESRI